MTKFTIPKIKKIILSALLLSVLIVLSRFLSIKTTFLVISLSFIPIMTSAIYLGPVSTGIIAGLGDLIGAILFPFGSYFPGFTLSAALMGLIYGKILYKNPNKNKSNKRLIFELIFSSLIVLIGVKIFLESIWLHLLYGKAYFAIISTRIVTQAIMLPIQVIVMFSLEKGLNIITKKYLYEEELISIEEYLNKFDKITKEPTLDAMEYFMNKFNRPEKELKIIHIAGTNGKGSVAEMINNCLINCGYKVGKFVSPYLLDFTDGISINNVNIKREDAEEILEKISKEVDNYTKQTKKPVKWFEIITTLVLIYFSEQKCDFVILETGLGGTYDCTNIVESMISIITKIGYDHVDLLGNTIESIAQHKAGIIKKNSQTIIFEQSDIMPIIQKKSEQQNTNLHIIKENDISNYSFNENLQKFSYKNYKDIEINLKGKSQVENAAETLECMEILKQKGFNISDDAVRHAMCRVVHKARFEKIFDNPTIIFDGGHNEDAIKNLRTNLEQYYKNSKKVFIVSILKTKDYKTDIKNLITNEDSIYIFTNGNDKKRYVSAKKMAKEAKKYITPDKIFSLEFAEAIKESKKLYKDRKVFIVGSFYVYKDAIEILGGNDD